MSREILALYAVAGILALLSIAMLLFTALGVSQSLLGDSVAGQIFITLIRGEGGATDLVKLAILPLTAGLAFAVDFSRVGPGWMKILIGLLTVYVLSLMAFFLLFQVNSIGEEVWVRDPDELFASQSAFEEAIRQFSYQSGSAVITYAIIVLGLRSRDRKGDGG